jgi:small conductance mechanosensitive channel
MIDKVIASLKARFDPDLVAKWLLELAPAVISALLTFFIFWLLYKIIYRFLDYVFERGTFDQTLSAFFKDLLKYVIVGAGLLAALSELGINTTSIIASLGVAGLTIGFAAKDTLSNLMSGLFIFWDRPFRVGDLVIIAGQYGQVSEITLRSTRVVTPDGKMISFPNSKVIDAPLTSYTNFPNLRLNYSVSFPATSNLCEIREEFIKLFKDDEQFLKHPAPAVNVIEFSTTQLKLDFLIWISDEKAHLTLESRFKEKVFGKFCQPQSCEPIS